MGAGPKEIKILFDLIGDIPQSDNYEKVKSIVDFNTRSLDMNELMNTEIRPRKHSLILILYFHLTFHF